MLLPVIVFFALCYTQSQAGNIGMDLGWISLPPEAADIAPPWRRLLMTIFICSVLAYFSAKNALQLWRYRRHHHDAALREDLAVGGRRSRSASFLVSLRIFVQSLHMLDRRAFRRTSR